MTESIDVGEGMALPAWIGLMAAFVLPIFGCARETPLPPPPQVRIDGQTWTVELAMTPRQRYEGLSGRRAIPAGRGMLFVFPSARSLSFCMRNCETPIDVAFIGPDLRVVNLYEMPIEPDRAGNTNYDSHLPAQYVLEVAGGTLRAAGVRIGSRVEMFGVPDASQAEDEPS
jgi:uncharacterized membrane protein (UPF0127 family)